MLCPGGWLSLCSGYIHIAPHDGSPCWLMEQTQGEARLHVFLGDLRQYSVFHLEVPLCTGPDKQPPPFWFWRRRSQLPSVRATPQKRPASFPFHVLDLRLWGRWPGFDLMHPDLMAPQETQALSGQVSEVGLPVEAGRGLGIGSGETGGLAVPPGKAGARAGSG